MTPKIVNKTIKYSCEGGQARLPTLSSFLLRKLLGRYSNDCQFVTN